MPRLRDDEQRTGECVFTTKTSESARPNPPHAGCTTHRCHLRTCRQQHRRHRQDCIGHGLIIPRPDVERRTTGPRFRHGHPGAHPLTARGQRHDTQPLSVSERPREGVPVHAPRSQSFRSHHLGPASAFPRRHATVRWARRGWCRCVRARECDATVGRHRDRPHAVVRGSWSSRGCVGWGPARQEGQRELCGRGVRCCRVMRCRVMRCRVMDWWRGHRRRMRRVHPR